MSEIRPLHLVNVAPPWQSGYTVRTQSLVAAQGALGMKAAVAVHPSWYLERSYRSIGDGVSVLDQDGVRYYRRTEANPVKRWMTRASQALVDHEIRGSRRLLRRLPLPDDPWQGFAEAVAAAHRPTVVHAHMPSANLDGAQRLGKILGIPIVYEVRGFWDLPGPDGADRSEVAGMPRDEWVRRETAACCEADATITLGHAMREELRLRGVPSRRVEIVGNCVDPSRFRPRSGKDPALLESLGLDGQFVLGYVTSVDRREGIETVLEALGELGKTGPRACFVLVGDGPDLPRLRERAREVGVEEMVRFVGRVPFDQVQRYYSLIDCFVVPRRDEAVCRIVTPLKPLEAMAQHIPVLASDLPALRELIAPGKRGYTFRAGDAGELAAAIRRAANRPEEVNQLATNALEWVYAKRTWQHAARETRELYARLQD